MDRHDLNHQVTVDEIIAELNRQIMNLNFELTVNKMALQKLQNLIAKTEETGNKTGEDFQVENNSYKKLF